MPVPQVPLHTTVGRYLALFLALLALLALVPCVVAVRELSESDRLPRWVWLPAMVAVLQIALAVYLWQATDRSSLCVATFWCTLLAIAYAGLFAWAIRIDSDNGLIGQLELDQVVANGQLAAWSFVSLGLNGLWCYFAGQRVARWHADVEDRRRQSTGMR